MKIRERARQMQELHFPDSTTLMIWGIVVFSVVVVAQIVMTWMIMPIYPDEIATRIWGARLFYDKWERLSVLGVCTASSSVPVPTVLIPAGVVLSSLSLIVDMSYNRIVAFGGLLACLVLVYFSLSRSAGRSANVIAMCLCVLACSIGVVAAAYFIIRPENFILALVALAIFTFSDNRGPRANFAIAVAAVLLFMMALYVHPKALYYLPAVMLVLVRTITVRHPLLLALGLGVLIWSAYEGYRINAKQFLSCPEVPSLEAFLNGFNVNLVSAFTNPGKFLSDLATNNISGRWVSMGRKMSFASSYDAGYLPGVKSSLLASICNVLMKVVALGVFVAAVFFGLKHLRVVSGSLFGRYRGDRGDDRARGGLDTIDHAGMLVMYLATTGYLFLNATQGWYDISAWMFIYVVLVVTSVTRFYGALIHRDAWRGESLTAPTLRTRRNLCGIVVFVLCTAGLGAIELRSSIYRDLAAGYAGPGIPIATSNFSEIGKNVHRAAAMCGLSSKSPRLIVDDLTYPFLEQSYKPFLITYGLFETPERFYALAKKQGSAGMVVRCNFIPATPELAGVKHDGNVCCFNSGL